MKLFEVRKKLVMVAEVEAEDEDAAWQAARDLPDYEWTLMDDYVTVEDEVDRDT